MLEQISSLLHVERFCLVALVMFTRSRRIVCSQQDENDWKDLFQRKWNLTIKFNFIFSITHWNSVQMAAKLIVYLKTKQQSSSSVYRSGYQHNLEEHQSISKITEDFMPLSFKRFIKDSITSPKALLVHLFISN